LQYEKILEKVSKKSESLEEKLKKDKEEATNISINEEVNFNALLANDHPILTDYLNRSLKIISLFNDLFNTKEYDDLINEFKAQSQKSPLNGDSNIINALMAEDEDSERENKSNKKISKRKKFLNGKRKRPSEINNKNGDLSIDVNDTSVSNIASANIVNLSRTLAISAFDQANTGNIRAIGAFDKANSASLEAGGAHAKANTACTTADYAVVTVAPAFNKANTANVTADYAVITVGSAFNQANTANIRAIGAFSQANSASFPVGTRLIFAQDTAPTGWAKDTSNYDDHALRVVTGTGGGTGGSVGFTTAFASRSITGSVGSTTLSEAQMPYHSHYMPGWSSTGMFGSPGSHGYGFVVDTSGAGAYPWYWLSFTGSSQGHNHSFTGTNLDLRVRYLNVITAVKQ
jgi:hypothetical protein